MFKGKGKKAKQHTENQNFFLSRLTPSTKNNDNDKDERTNERVDMCNNNQNDH